MPPKPDPEKFSTLQVPKRKKKRGKLPAEFHGERQQSEPTLAGSAMVTESAPMPAISTPMNLHVAEVSPEKKLEHAVRLFERMDFNIPAELIAAFSAQPDYLRNYPDKKKELGLKACLLLSGRSADPSLFLYEFNGFLQQLSNLLYTENLHGKKLLAERLGFLIEPFVKNSLFQGLQHTLHLFKENDLTRSPEFFCRMIATIDILVHCTHIQLTATEQQLLLNAKFIAATVWFLAEPSNREIFILSRMYSTADLADLRLLDIKFALFSDLFAMPAAELLSQITAANNAQEATELLLQLRLAYSDKMVAYPARIFLENVRIIAKHFETSLTADPDNEDIQAHVYSQVANWVGGLKAKIFPLLESSQTSLDASQQQVLTENLQKLAGLLQIVAAAPLVAEATGVEDYKALAAGLETGLTKKAEKHGASNGWNTPELAKLARAGSIFYHRSEGKSIDVKKAVAAYQQQHCCAQEVGKDDAIIKGPRMRTLSSASS